MVLLRLIQEGGSISSADLARRANLSDGLTTRAIHDLVRGGFLEAIQDSKLGACAPTCGDCQASEICRLPVWKLTDKARRQMASH
jgi:hypothetical protein